MNTIEVIKEISDIAIQIPQVRKVSDGDVYTNWNSGEIEYGSVNIAISNITKQEQTLTYTIYLYYGDRLLQDKSNYTNVCTDAEYVLNLIINTLEGEVEEPYDITFFEQHFADYLAGGYVIFNYTVDSNIGECELDFTKPEYTLEIHSNGVFDVKNYDKVDVDINTAILQEKTISDITQPVLPDEGYNGLSKVNIGEEIEGTYLTSRLPNEYVEVEWIQNIGFAYIPLNYYARTKTTYLYVDYEKLANNTTYCPIVGQENSIRYGVYSSSSYTDRACIWLGDIKNDVFNYWDCPIGVRNKVFFGDGILKVNDTIVAQKYTATDKVSTISMVYNASPTESGYRGTYSNGKLYEIRLYEYETLVRQYIPCYRVSDNAVGLYEILTNTFHPKEGSGYFIVGGDVYRGVYEYNITLDGTYKIGNTVINVSTSGEIKSYKENGTYLLGNNLININVS